jgi:hypothetical protein
MILKMIKTQMLSIYLVIFIGVTHLLRIKVDYQIPILATNLYTTHVSVKSLSLFCDHMNQNCAIGLVLFVSLCRGHENYSCHNYYVKFVTFK